MRDVELDLRNVGVERWRWRRRRALDRTEWESVVREGEAKLEGFWS